LFDRTIGAVVSLCRFSGLRAALRAVGLSHTRLRAGIPAACCAGHSCYVSDGSACLWSSFTSQAAPLFARCPPIRAGGSIAPPPQQALFDKDGKFIPRKTGSNESEADLIRRGDATE